MSFDIKSILGNLEQAVIQASGDSLQNLKDSTVANFEDLLKQAAGDAIAFVSSAVPFLGKYTDLYIQKLITSDELESLILGLKDLAEMNGLTQAGLAAIQIDNTRNSILKVVTSTLIGAVSKAV